LFSTKRYGGWGLWLRDAGRGPQEIAKIGKIAKIAEIENHGIARNRRHRKSKSLTTVNTDDTDQKPIDLVSGDLVIAKQQCPTADLCGPEKAKAKTKPECISSQPHGKIIF
jgi:hypothetical protein